FALSHLKRFSDHGSHNVGIVRVDEQGAALELCSGACEFAQNQNTLRVDPCGAEFFRHQIHPVFKWCDNCNVRSSIESDQFLPRDRSVKILNGYPSGYAVLTVYFANQHLDSQFEI